MEYIESDYSYLIDWIEDLYTCFLYIAEAQEA